MPTYDYACTNCKKTWEAEQVITEPANKLCPYCKEETAKRLISRGTGFILEGDGWANQGYSKK